MCDIHGAVFHGTLTVETLVDVVLTVVVVDFEIEDDVGAELS